MEKLLIFEFRKLFKSKYFYILMGLSIAFVLISGITENALINATAALYEIEEPISINGYSFVKAILGGSAFSIIIAIFISLFACEDAMHGTNKNVLAKGYKREYVFLSKYLVSLLMTLLIALLTVLVGYILANALWDFSVIEGDKVIAIICGQLLGLLSYHALYFFIAYTVGKNGLAISLNIVGPIVVSLLLNMLDALINSDKITLSQYWLSSGYSYFTDGANGDLSMTTNFIILVVYFVGFLALGFFLNRKKEIK